MSHKQDVLTALQRGETITALDALNRWGCFRLAARIYDLKQDGVRIDDIDVTTKSGKTVKGYRIAEPMLVGW